MRGFLKAIFATFVLLVAVSCAPRSKYVVVEGYMLGTTFRFSGLASLKIKETDRTAALRTELRKLGYVVREDGDSVVYWDGERCQAENNPVIETYEDHRMAMAFAPVCMKQGNVCIAHPEVVSKSYPNFWNDFTMLK